MASGKRAGAKASVPASPTIDRDTQQLAQSAAAKQRSGEQPTQREQRALAKIHAHQRATLGPEYAHGCPKGELLERTGISAKVMGEQSRRFGLPYHKAGKTVDLFAHIAAWHAWASENKHLLTRMLKSKELAEVLGDGDDESLEYWQTELVKERTLRERDARAERHGELAPVDIIWDFLQVYFVAPMLQRQEHCDGRTEKIEPAEAAAWFRTILKQLDQAKEQLINVERDQAFAEIAD